MTQMQIPAAEWSESDEGARSLVAKSGEATVEFEPPADPRGEGFIFVREHGHHAGLILSADGARATVAVLTRWLAETEPQRADHPPHLLDDEPDGMVFVSDSMREYRGFRYIRVGGKWQRTHQIPEVKP